MNRVVPALILAASWLLLLLFGGRVIFSLLLAGMALMAAFEYVRMMDDSGSKWVRFFLMPLLILPVLGAVITQEVSGLLAGLIVSFMLLTFLVLLGYNKLGNVFILYSRAAFGLVYVGCLFAFLPMIYLLPDGNLWLIVLTAITSGSDTGAYMVGSKFGKHKLCPHISPKKTVEGVLGGLVFGALFAFFFSMFVLPDRLWMASCSAVLFSAVGMTGDLVESVVKRAFDIKDSGTILAGHGGVLDRMDSLIFVAPWFYYFLIVCPGR
ncbi:MAG: hypothetical protein CSB24_00520 [Deltaproteobacteria bacterium]|nr:MAG: hypothetical protein CSB24_00520 [Deltaproteobacteria bacterium]